MAKIYLVIQKTESASLRKMSTYKAYLSATTFLRVFTYKMAAKINCHRYGTKLRHCHPMYEERFFLHRWPAADSSFLSHVQRGLFPPGPW